MAQRLVDARLQRQHVQALLGARPEVLNASVQSEVSLLESPCRKFSGGGFFVSPLGNERMLAPACLRGELTVLASKSSPPFFLTIEKIRKFGPD